MSEIAVTVEWKRDLPDLTTVDNMTQATGTTSKRFNEYQKSFRMRNEIEPAWRLRYQGDKKKFLHEVCEWLKADLSEDDKRATYPVKGHWRAYITLWYILGQMDGIIVSGLGER